MVIRFWITFLCCAARSSQLLNGSTSGAVACRLGSPQHHTLSLSVTDFVSLSTPSLSTKLSSWSWVIRSSTSVVSHSFLVICSSGVCVIFRPLTVPCQVLLHEQDADTWQLFPCRLSSECFFLQVTPATIAPLFLLDFLPGLTLQWKTCRFFL